MLEETAVQSLPLAIQLMMEYAASTGLSGTSPPRRYLWTDAFAVCNYLGIYQQTGHREFLDHAIKLVDEVHHILGRHRHDDQRQGWISGFPEREGELHPTCRGLRIGKPFNERPANQPVDPELEWDRDGQYFHYLTKWMHALNRMAQITGENRYLEWAVELAVVAQQTFTRSSLPGCSKRMVWKMSIDLSRPLVPSMGQHDPLDGLITCLELRSEPGFDPACGTELGHCVEELTEMCSRSELITNDPLGIGGLMDDASRLAQLVFRRGVKRRALLHQLLIGIQESMSDFCDSPLLREPAERRLAFRELGLSIGIHGLEWIKGIVTQDDELNGMIDVLLDHAAVAEEIESFWSSPTNHRTHSWTAHCDINTVMLATSLAPAGYLRIATANQFTNS